MATVGGRGPVMADVARAAGVSHQTVSRVINGHPNVREATVARVRRAITELGYHPDPTARALVTRRTNVLGLLVAEATSFGSARVLAGVERAAREKGYFLSVACADAPGPERVAGAVERLTRQSVEGYVAMADLGETVRALAALPGTRPVVLVEGGAGQALPTAGTDQERGVREAVRHLLGLGHRTVHHFADRPDRPEAGARVRGWREELRAAGRPVPELLRGDRSPRSGHELGRALIARRAAGEGATAVLAADDRMALGLLKALHEAGLDVPGDVSVVGFDDVPEAAYLAPALTTVAQDFTAVGTAALELLLEVLEAPAGAVADRTVPPRLRVRASSAPPPAAG